MRFFKFDEYMTKIWIQSGIWIFLCRNFTAQRLTKNGWQSSGVWPLELGALAPAVYLWWDPAGPLLQWMQTPIFEEKMDIYGTNSIYRITQNYFIEETFETHGPQCMVYSAEQSHRGGLGHCKIILHISSSSLAAAMCKAVEPMPFLSEIRHKFPKPRGEFRNPWVRLQKMHRVLVILLRLLLATREAALSH